MNSGIYKILNVVTNKFYIGSAVYINARWAQHRYSFRNNRHDNTILQRSWNKHGEKAFEFSIIELTEPKELLKREQYWIDNLNACNRKIGYNIRIVAHSNLGTIRTDETRAKISKAKTGVKQTREAVENRAKMLRGKPRSEETKAKISAGHKGKILTAEHRAKMSAAKQKKHDKLFENIQVISY